jgi:flagellar motor switch/type III secretory pathway protein FliN
LTQDFRDWLPVDAITGPSFTAIFGPIVDAWAERWFGGSRVVLHDVQPREPKPSFKPMTGPWRYLTDDICVSCDGDMQAALAGLALDVRQDMPKLSADDHMLIGDFALRMFEDLARSLSQSLDIEADLRGGEAVRPFADEATLDLFIADDDKRTAFIVAIAAPALFRLRKRQCARFIPEKLAALSITDILGGVSVGFEARLGRANMSARDLHDIAEGDVVVLDRPLASPLELFGETSGRLLFKAMLEQNDGDLALIACAIEGNKT